MRPKNLHPRLEHLIKIGFDRLASDLAYGRAGYGLLDEARHRTHRILQVAPEYHANIDLHHDG